MLNANDFKKKQIIFLFKNKPDKKIIQGSGERRSYTDYKKMVYNLFPGPNKMLPKIFFSKNFYTNTYYNCVLRMISRCFFCFSSNSQRKNQEITYYLMKPELFSMFFRI